MRCLLTVVAAVLISQPVQAVQLFGGLEHRDSLPDASELKATAEQHQPNFQSEHAMLAPAVPMQGEASTQAPLQGAVATLQRPAVEWFMIPVWMAGRWHKRGDMTVSVTDLVTGRTGMPNVWTDNDMTVRWGHQSDRAGNIWHANFIPAEKDGESGGDIVRFLTVAQSCEKTTPQVLITRTHYVVTKSPQGGNEVLESYQQESLNNYALTADGELENQSSNKMFHMNGKAYRIGTLESRFSRIQGFMPANFDRGIDMRIALTDYLHRQNLDHLIPETETSNALPPGLVQ